MTGAALFFARNFFATEFPRFAREAIAGPRVYIVISESEAATVRSEDPEGEIYILGQVTPAGPRDDGAAVNRDRTLRLLPRDEIAAVRGAVAGVCDAILARHSPRFYFDEPVSGYPNEVFNRRFTEAGALCLHFQTTWIPGYGFFTSDTAQGVPIPLSLCPNGSELVTQHVRQRAAGGGLPLYMMGYGKLSRRLADLSIALGKAAYRATVRSGAHYIDRDRGAHLLHARCLAQSLAGDYGVDPVSDLQPGPEGAKMVVFPLHYEPEAVLLYYSAFLRQEEIVARMLDVLPPDWTLVVKEHPSQPGALRLPKWRGLMKTRRIVPLTGTYPGARLLAHKPVVVSIGSTFALEAAFAGCRVGLLGNVHFANAPGIVKLADPNEWPVLLQKPGPDTASMTAWYGHFMQRYAFAGNFQRGKTWIEEPDRLAATLEAATAAHHPLAETAA